MKKETLNCQQYRLAMGRHAQWSNQFLEEKRMQDQRVCTLAAQPGRHRGNWRRQDITKAMVQLLAMLTVVENRGTILPIASKKRDSKTLETACERLNHAVLPKCQSIYNKTASFPCSFTLRPKGDTKSCRKGTDLRKLMATEKDNSHSNYQKKEEIKQNSISKRDSVERTNWIPNLWCFVSDPLAFPMAMATPLPAEIHTTNTAHKSILTTESSFISKKPTPIKFMHLSQNSHTFIRFGLQRITQFYLEYAKQFPDLVIFGARMLQKEIYQKFNIELDPNGAYMVSLQDNQYSEGYYKNTLTRFLFTNFSTEIQSNMINVDKKYGIYAQPSITGQLLDESLKIPIKPSDFVKLIWEIDFHKYIITWSSEGAVNENKHIKKNVYDFLFGLYNSNLDQKSIKAILMAVGLFPDSDNIARISLFDLNGYKALTLFVFTYPFNARITLYLPDNKKKFISFFNYDDMCLWVKSRYYLRNQLETFLSHFRISFRKFSYDHDFDYLKKHTKYNPTIYINKVCLNTYKTNFFIYLFDQIQLKKMLDIKDFEDLDMTSKARMWRILGETPALVFPSITPFFSLGMHLDHLFELQNETEKKREWDRLHHNKLNIPLLILIKQEIDNKENTDFLNDFKTNIKHVSVKFAENVLSTLNHTHVSLPSNQTPSYVKNRFSVNDADGRTIHFILNNNNAPKSNVSDYTPITRGFRVIEKFYFDYLERYPELSTLATQLLHEKIKERFQIELNPDQTYFMVFNDVMYNQGKKWHYIKPISSQRLTDYLFTNFDAQFQEEIIDVDAMCGIYSTSKLDTLPIDTSIEIAIKPSDFINLIWDIDFYNYAKVQILKKFEDEGIHLKKYFYDFMMGLQISSLNDEEMNDVLTAVGLKKYNKNNYMKIFLLDINGYMASTLFVIKNHVNERVILYLSEIEKKFVSFVNEMAMRNWIIKVCAISKLRNQIASHFTLASRQDGAIYYGVDTWLAYFEKHPDYTDVILTKYAQVATGKDFFLLLFNYKKIKQLADLDYLIESDWNIKRNIWERDIEASTVLVNPISPFLSLAFHLEHAIETNRYDEKRKEWKKVGYDGLNLALLALLDTSLKFHGDNDAFISAFEDELYETENALKRNSEEPLNYNCFRRKRGISFGKLCRDNNEPLDESVSEFETSLNLLSSNGVKLSSFEMRVVRETQIIIQEWPSHIDIDTVTVDEQDIEVLENLALNMKESPALNDYAEGGNEGINQYLRYSIDTSEDTYRHDTRSLLDAYQELNDYPDFSYRVMLLPRERLHAISINDIVADKGFSSSSALINNAKTWIEDGFITQYKEPGKDYAVIVYDKSVSKKIASTDFLIDHILIAPGTKLKVNGIEILINSNQKLWFLAVTSYDGEASAADIFTGETIPSTFHY